MTRHTADDLPPERTFPHEPDSGGRHGLTGYVRNAWGQMHLLLFIVAIAMASFAYGSLVGRYQLFPYSIISDGLKTLRTLRDTTGAADIGQFDRFVDDEEIDQTMDDEEIDQTMDDEEIVQTVDDGMYRQFSNSLLESAVANRIEFLASDSLHEPLLWYSLSPELRIPRRHADTRTESSSASC